MSAVAEMPLYNWLANHRLHSLTTMANRGTPPKPSSLPDDILNKLQVELALDVEEAKQKYDLEGILSFQRMYVRLMSINELQLIEG